MNYSAWTSTNLASWMIDEGAVLTPGPVVNDVQPVSVQLSAGLLNQPKLFVRIGTDAPLPLFARDFEADGGGFTVATVGGTAWQHGVPNSPTQMEGAVTSANSGTQCWGTNLTGGYGSGTNTALRSPVINLTDVTGTTLTFARAIDAASGHTLEVNVIGENTDGVIAVVIPPTGDSDTNSAAWAMIGPVTLPPAAFDQPVRLEWRFIGNGDGTYNGVYLDDVILTESP